MICRHCQADLRHHNMNAEWLEGEWRGQGPYDGRLLRLRLECSHCGAGYLLENVPEAKFLDDDKLPL